MIEIASPATPQLASLLLRIVRPRRWRSPKSAPRAHHHHLRSEKSDPIVDILRSRQNPKIIRIDDAEVVADRITKFRPVLGDFFA